MFAVVERSWDLRINMRMVFLDMIPLFFMKMAARNDGYDECQQSNKSCTLGSLSLSC
jgi:hypothetical protein